VTDKNAKFITGMFWSLGFGYLNLFRIWKIGFGIFRFHPHPNPLPSREREEESRLSRCLPILPLVGEGTGVGGLDPFT
jgi:hypothetical protein